MTGTRNLASRALHALPAGVKLPMRRLIHGAKRRRFASKEIQAIARAESPILVFQMGKVGSRTVFRTLLATEDVGPVTHIHQLTDLEEARRQHVAAGIIPLPIHLHTSARLVALLPDKHFRIVAGVRDPIARLVSGYFQTPMFELRPERFGYLGLPDQMAQWRRSIDPVGLVELVERQLAAGDDGGFSEWFEEQLKPAFGIDALAHPFDTTAGFGIVRTDRADVLIMQAERLSDLIPTILSDFVGAQLVEVPSNIRSGDVAGSSAYRKALELIRIPEATCELIYSQPAVTHFYDEATIQHWTKRWTGGRA